MNSMLLTIDIGNTITTLGLFVGDSLHAHWRIASDRHRTPEEYGVLLKNLQSLDAENTTSAITAAALVSVVPTLTGIWRETLKQFWKITPLVLDHSSPLNFRILYEHPEEVGPDRLANVLGGKARFGTPLIIVDFGTATTLDVVNRNGDYEGGIILPGIESSIEVLFERTSRLPLIPLEIPETSIGKRTRESMQIGILLGLIEAVEGLIRRCWQQLGYETGVVATGGEAELLAPHSQLIREVEPFLTLYGLQQFSQLKPHR